MSELTTLGIKMDSNLKEEIANLINEYKEDDNSKTQADFMEMLKDTYKTHKLSNTTVDSKSELKELMRLTSRIHNMYSNMIERNIVGIDSINAEARDRLKENEDKIREIKSKFDTELQKSKNLTESLEFMQKEYQGLAQEYKKLHNISEKNDKLIAKLEDETKDLKRLKNENTNMRVQLDGFEDEVKRIEDEKLVLIKEIENLKQTNESTLNSINEIKSKYESKMEDLKKALDFEKQQEILELKQEFQHQLQIKDNEIIKIKNEYLSEKQDQQNKYSNLTEENIRLKESVKELNDRLNKI